MTSESDNGSVEQDVGNAGKQKRFATIVGGACALIGLIYFFPSFLAAMLLGLFDANDAQLEASLRQGPAVLTMYTQILEIVNKGPQPVTILKVQFNDRPEKECSKEEIQKLRMGDVYTDLVLGCGRIVRVKVVTDRGTSVFNW